MPGAHGTAHHHFQIWTIADGVADSSIIDTGGHGWGGIKVPTLDGGQVLLFLGAAEPDDTFALINTAAGAAISLTSVAGQWTGYVDELASVIAAFRFIKIRAAGNQTGIKTGEISLKG